MRIDGVSTHSYPIKRKPRKGNPALDESVEDIEGELEFPTEAQTGCPRRQGSPTAHREAETAKAHRG